MRKYTLYVLPYAEFTRTHVYIVHIISQLGGVMVRWLIWDSIPILQRTISPVHSPKIE